ncbi:MAG: oxygenase MpaB family protein [Planctomycetaceae bacterium]
MNTSKKSFLPTNRINPEARIDESNPAVQMVARMVRAGDPLADALAAKLKELGPVGRKQFDEGLANGLASLSDPPEELANLLRHMESFATEIDPDELKKPMVAVCSIEPIWTQVAFAFASLFHTYSNSAMSRILVSTGRLVEQASHRVAETDLWQLRVDMPGGSLQGAPGYVSIGQVRVLHSIVRLSLLRKGWDVETWGMPISQLDLARTWLDFTLFPYRALEKLGFDFTPEELSHRYTCWRHIGHLLGIDPELIQHLKNHEDAQELLDLINLAEDRPDDNCRKLTGALMEAMIPVFSSHFKIPMRLMHDICHAITRYVCGDQLADDLHVESPDVLHLMPLFVHDNQMTRYLLRTNPREWEKYLDANLQAYRARIDELATQGGQFESFLTKRNHVEPGRNQKQWQ